jgi:hypothetical protein
MLADRPDDWQERKADLGDEKQEAIQAEMDAIRNEIANEGKSAKSDEQVTEPK